MLLLLFAYYNGNFDESSISDSGTNVLPSHNEIILGDYAIEHILYGNESGGGHLSGVGKPCKSEFPSDWDEQEVIDTVKKIAANDNLPWKRQDNGYYVAEKMEDGIRVRVVLGREKKKVITAYPTNVERNPCPPHSANDNYNP